MPSLPGICASNANKVLTDFIRTGVYDRRRPLLKTTSPSMDILVSSNLERLLYLMTLDTEFVASCMAQLTDRGHYALPGALTEQIQSHFWADWCDDAAAAQTIARVFAREHYLCDPHTAAGWYAAENYVNQTGDQTPMVVLSTASPYKFPAVVLAAIGQEAQGDEFHQMEQLEAASGVPIPGNLSRLRQKRERHPDVIARDQMLSYVINRENPLG